MITMANKPPVLSHEPVLDHASIVPGENLFSGQRFKLVPTTVGRFHIYQSLILNLVMTKSFKLKSMHANKQYLIQLPSFIDSCGTTDQDLVGKREMISALKFQKDYITLRNWLARTFLPQ
jgi:hypothetical protein